MCCPYKEGGLAIRDIETTNEAAGMRHVRDLLSDKDSVWTDWIKANLIKEKNFWSLYCHQDASWRWRHILVKDKLLLNS